MRRTFDELERLAYIEGRSSVVLDLVDAEIVDAEERLWSDIRQAESERDELLTEVKILRQDLDNAVHLVTRLEDKLRRVREALN